jgi:hypothetical protein
LVIHAAILMILLVPRAASAGPSVIFADSFQSGDTSAWSQTVGSRFREPEQICAPPIAAVDTSGATVVGNGSPASCSEAALDAALANNNGAIRFDCGGVSFFNPGLGPLRTNGGPTPTILPGAVSDTATGFPVADQRGQPRSNPCTPGAVELP